MPETFLNSPGLLMDALSKEMLLCLNHYPLLAIKHKKIESLYDKFQLLFNGEYRSVGFHTTMLHSCIMQYCECILVFVQDNSVSMKKDKVDYLRRWFSVLDNLGGVNGIKNVFTFFMPVLEDVIYKDYIPPWVKKEFMQHLNRIFEKSTKLIFKKKEKKDFFRIVTGWLKLIVTCGDYEFQTILVEAIISTCDLGHIKEVLVRNFGDTSGLTRMFLEVYSKQNYINDLKTFLNNINDRFEYIRSVPCLKVILEETVIPPLKGTNGDETWIHINYEFRTLSFDCQQDSLRSLPSSVNHSNFCEFVTVSFEDIDKVGLLINNDFKTANPVGGMFLINLNGKCSCRYNSSKDIVSSIKKITLTVSDGLRVQYLKETFVKLFGSRFKEDNKIRSKKRNFYDRRVSLNSSTSNSSYRAEKRKIGKKHNDSMNSSPGSIFLKNFKLENSFTSENKENVWEGTKNCSLSFAESPFKMPLVVNHKKLSNSQLSISPTIVKNWLSTEKYLSAKVDWKGKQILGHSESDRSMSSYDLMNSSQGSIFLENSFTSENKENVLEGAKNCSLSFTESSFKMPVVDNHKKPTNSQTSISPTIIKNWLSTEKYLSAKVDWKGKHNLGHSESDRSMSPDTKSNSFNKSKGKEERGTSKDNFSLLKSWNIDTLTTSKNEEIPESSKISLVVASTEEMTIPSNYKFGEDNSLTMLEENKSVICDFINSSIPDLRSPLDYVSKVSTTKAENSSIADSPATSDINIQAKSSNDDSQLNFLQKYFNLSEMTSNSNEKGRISEASLLKELSQKNTAESGILWSTVRPFNFAEEIEKFSNAPCFKEFNQSTDNSETPDIDLILANSTNNITRSKNSDEEEEVIEIIDDADQTVVDELNRNTENANEEVRNADISITSILSTEEIDLDASTEVTVNLNQQIENRQYDDIAETAAGGQNLLILEINDIKVASENHQDRISTSSTEGTSIQVVSEHNYFSAEKAELTVKHDDAVIEELQILGIKDIIANDYFYASNLLPMHEMPNDFKSASNRCNCSPILLNEIDYREQIENRQYDDIDETAAGGQNRLILEINDIKVASENHQDRISTSSTEGISIQVVSEHNYSSAEKPELALKYDDAVIEELQILAIKDIIANDHCYASNSTPMHEMANETKNDEHHFVKSASNKCNRSPILLNEIDYREQIENRQYDDIDETAAGGQNLLILEINDIKVASENHQDRISTSSTEGTSIQVVSEHNYSSAEKTELTLKHDDAVIEELEILAIKDIIANDHCYASNSTPMHEMASETKNDEHHFIKSAGNNCNRSPILLNEIDYRKKASPIVGLRNLNKGTEELENSFHSMTTKSREHISGNNDYQLLKETYVATCNDLQESQNEVARLYAELALKTQRIEEQERINRTLELTQTSKPEKTCKKKSVTSERKQSKEHITSQSETSNGNFQNSFQDFIKSPRNHLVDNNFLMNNEEKNKSKSYEESDYFQKLQKPLEDLPTENLLLNKLNASETKSVEIDFEMLISRNELNSQELTLSPKMSLFDMIATNQKQNVTPLTREVQAGEFSKKPLSGKTATPEKKIKLAENVQFSRNMHKPKEDNFATLPLKFSELRKSTPIPKTHQSKKVNEDFSFIQGFESIPPFEPVKVTQLVKENSFKKLEGLNEEFGLITKQTTESGNKLNKNIEFDFDDINTGDGGLYNLIDKPHKLSKKSDKTEEHISNKSNKVQCDENYYKRTNEIYGFDAMLNGLKWYLSTLKPPVEKKKKLQKKRIIKMKLGGHKKAKSKAKKTNFGQLF